MSYTLRDEHGVMIAKVDNAIASKIIGNCQGYFRLYRVNGKKDCQVFEITKDHVFDLESFRLYFWAKTVLIPDHAS